MKCRTCNEIIEDKIAHYQSPVHEENIRRKITGQAPVKQIDIPEKQEILQRKTEGRNTEETGVYSLKENECLYCNERPTEYIAHLETHGFKLLLQQYIVDLEGLINHLKEKISYCICTCCNKRFSCISKTRAHMESMNHTGYINTEEYDSFYSYPERGIGYVSEDGSELYLPSGRVAGNKKYNRYYAQTLRDIEYYREMNKTYTQITTREAPEQTEEEKIKIRQFTERQHRSQLKIGRSNNNQKHFRDDWMQ